MKPPKLDLSQMVGVKREPSFSAIPLEATPIEPISAWTKYAIPTYNQRFPSCVGHATANWFEMMLRFKLGRKAIPAGKQIDGDAIWRKARKMFWSREPLEDGGLLMDQGFRAAIELGILPPNSGVMQVRMDVGMLSRMLHTEPVLQGTGVHRNWSAASRQNGQIPFDLPDPNAGHATCIVGVIMQDGEPYVLFQNSWGADWGYKGYGLMRADQWEQSLLGPLTVCKLPDDYGDWTGWKNYLIDTP